MRTTNYDALATAAPLNRTASVVRDGSGEHYHTAVPAHVPHWDTPPPPEGLRSADCPDLTGVQFGQMRVVRYHGRNKGQKGSMWLCRCSCGAYELRRGKVIRAGTKAAGGNACFNCDRVRRMREGRFKTSRAADEARLDAIARGERP